jgi:Lrp/AsnC family transcriptional regulator, leucine-responsive regulatory protein
MKYDDVLDIDETDKKIIALLQNDPEMTHSDIAEKVHKSQPAVGARIIKLKRKHLLKEIIGAEFKELDLKLARIDIFAKNVPTLWKRFYDCPYITNCFKVTGEYNLSVEIVAPDVKSIDLFVDNCLRKEESIINIRTNFIIDSMRKYIVPLSFEIEKYELYGCSFECGGGINKNELVEILNS